MKIIIIFVILFHFNASYANNNIGKVTGESIPRFVTIKSSEANLRVGPNKDYPILIKYIRKNIPVMIIDEFKLYGDEWRKIVDWDNNEGWMHRSLLSNKRYGLLINNRDLAYINVFSKPDKKIIGKIGRTNIVHLTKCINNWCKIKIEDYTGWIKKNDIWGVFDHENFD